MNGTGERLASAGTLTFALPSPRVSGMAIVPVDSTRLIGEGQ